ncbi:MAG: ABC transporter ATP-binding protein [Rothia sp. (in: high G+C Gram-positive bacteria)]|nr:ABC transporter ATP-binding protein [Rothia sp. (in: high G+C Gram-positive bacteria)]
MISDNSTGLVLRGVSKAFKSGRRGEVEVLRTVNVQVNRGEFLAVIGASGTGKTTLLRIIAGLDVASAGSITFDGAPLVAGEVGYVFQKPVLYPHLTIKQNIRFGSSLKKHHQPLDQAHYDLLIRTLGLAGVEERMPHELSGGQQQRVGIARALVRKPVLVLFDEPLSSVDESLSASIRADLKNLHQQLNFTALFITHHLQEALQLGQRVAVMVEGQLVQVDTPENILRNPVSLAVAQFVGQPYVNVLSVQNQDGESQKISVRASTIEADADLTNRAVGVITAIEETSIGKLLTVSLTQEARWRCHNGQNALMPAATQVIFFGRAERAGQAVLLGVRPEDCRIFPNE